MSLNVPATVISFIRHGEVRNPQGILYGRLPRFGLSEQGRAQARAIAEALRGQQIAAVYSSPMLRARQTAQAILDVRPGLPMHLSKLINEVHSSHEGRPLAELKASGWDLYTGSEFEQPHDVQQRALRFIDRTRKQHQGRHVVVVTHGDVIAFIICWAKRLSVNSYKPEVLLGAGIPGGYPALGSITTLRFHTTHRDPDYRPEITYQALFPEQAE